MKPVFSIPTRCRILWRKSSNDRNIPWAGQPTFAQPNFLSLMFNVAKTSAIISQNGSHTKRIVLGIKFKELNPIIGKPRSKIAIQF